MATEELHGSVDARLAAQGQRYTRNRRALVDLLVDAGNPVSLPELLERDRSLSQSSTYRNLAVLEEAGAVRRLVTGAEHARFELAEDLTEHHHHMVCDECGSVVDFSLPDELEAALDAALAAAARSTAFTARHHSLDLVGRCAGCA